MQVQAHFGASAQELVDYLLQLEQYRYAKKDDQSNQKLGQHGQLAVGIYKNQLASATSLIFQLLSGFYVFILITNCYIINSTIGNKYAGYGSKTHKK
jgi:hypothetical protein